MKAYIVIEDCQLALERLRYSETQFDLNEVKLDWLLCLTLLRTIGHVLKNEYPDKAFKDKMGEPIFKDLIKAERDSFLKEYVYHLNSEKVIIQKPVYWQTGDGSYIETGNGEKIETGKKEFKTINFCKGDGYGQGKPLSLVIEEGIIWWEEYLQKIK